MAEDTNADFELIFHPHGTVSLIDCEDDSLVWSSDADDEFTEQFNGDDFFDADRDSERIIAYLESEDYVNGEEDVIDIIEETSEAPNNSDHS